MIKSKKGSAWIWILIILIIIGVGIGVYILFTNPGAIVSGPGSSIPQPPALPN
jgi:flagellar basal body-associated protein FliL